jgi:hypothetical protein
MKIQILENTKNISKKNEYIKKYDLKYIGNYKCYKILNTYINSDSNIISFEKHKYINNKEYLIEFITLFSFYSVEKEFIYDKYMNDNYILKCYDNHITLELIDK